MRFLQLSRQEMMMALIIHKVVRTVRSGYIRNRFFLFYFLQVDFMRGLAENLHGSAIH